MALFSLLISLLAAAGCTSSTLERCTSNSDCDEGEHCLDGRCLPEGDGDADSDSDGDADADGDGDGDGDGDSDADVCPASQRCGAECCAVEEECVEGRCLPPCASGLRCGDELLCCDAGDLCIAGACTTPGDPCVEAMDCPADAYCEPELGRCLPRTDERCEYYPDSSTFEPREQWAWTGSEVEPASVQVMMAPVVGDLDGDGVPEVVFNTYTAAGSYGGPGVLRIVRGDTGEEIRSITDPVVCPEAGIALGDLDGDGVPEIVTAGPCVGPLLAFHMDGALVWQSHDASGAEISVSMQFGAPSIADLEGDGLAEVVSGGAVFEHDGVLRWANRFSAGANCCWATPRSPTTAVYDVDLDGALEVVAGNAVWRADGTPLWERPELVDGFVAVADFFEDGTPDVVVVHDGFVSIRAGATGDVLWGPEPLPGGGRGGPPTVADFDNDGLPEIGVAGSYRYAVYDPDGALPILWEFVTEDDSSNITGSSVFDFDGDGSAEVVYNDECFMRVFSGVDGTILAEVAQNSHTLIEYPLIVDVDADGNAEIVFAANAAVAACSQASSSDYDGLRHGIRVFGDSLDNWVGTRTVWNQHTYHITNIRQDLSVPAPEMPNFRRFNNFRQNSQSFDAPDLEPDALSVDTTGCPASVTLRAVVQNNGAASVGAGLAVSFYVGTPEGEHRLVGTARVETPLVPGASASVELSFVPEPGEQNVEVPFFVRVDDAGDGVGEHNECVETNNLASDSLFCEGVG
jgi:hypothetical protein